MNDDGSMDERENFPQAALGAAGNAGLDDPGRAPPDVAAIEEGHDEMALDREENDMEQDETTERPHAANAQRDESRRDRGEEENREESKHREDAAVRRSRTGRPLRRPYRQEEFNANGEAAIDEVLRARSRK